MHDHVADLGPLAADPLLDLAGARVSVGQRGAGVERERQVGEQPVVGAQEAQLARRLAGLLPDDPLDEVAVAVDALALGGLGQRLEVRLHRVHLRHRLDDRPLDLGGDLVRVLERQLARAA